MNTFTKRLCFSALLMLFTKLAYTQSRIFINPVAFTQTVVRLYVGACNSDPNTIHLTLNGQAFPHTKDGIGYGLFMDVHWEFGTMKPGDILAVTDDCGSIGHQITVKDDFVYVEVPAGTGYPGNGIGPNDQFSPYSYLVNPVNVGKCAPVPFNAHVLSAVTLYSLGTNGGNTGTVKINGSPVNSAQFDISHNGAQGVVYSFNANGSWQTSNVLRLDGNTFYSGASPVTIEYAANGNDNNQFIMGIGGMQFYEIHNGSYKIRKGSYTGGTTETTHTGSFANAVFKITYDQAYYRAYVDGVLVDELKRFVVYTATGGSISNTAPLDYLTGVTYTPTTSGNQLITAVVDGVRYVSQKMNVANDLAINETVINVACGGGNTGKITATTIGGLSPLSYSINNGAFGSSNVFSNLTAGSYVVKVRDASGCIVSKNISVSAGTSLTASAPSKSDVVCAGNTNGSVTVAQSGGAGPFTYSKDGTNFVNNATFGSLSEGNYTFTVKDANGCTAATTATIAFQSKIVITNISPQNPTCFGGTGSATINTTGSTAVGTLQYSKDGTNFQTSPIFLGLSANSYTLTAKDNLCQATGTVSISQPSDISASLAVSSNVNCNGNSDAVIAVSASGGTGTLSYSKDNVNYGTNASFSGLPANNYTVWVKDANGCIKQSNAVTVSQPTILVPSVSSTTNVKCFGGNDATVTLSASGASPSYQYSKDGTNFQAAATLTGLSVGANQVFTVKDAKGCIKTITTSISQPAAALGITLANKNNLNCFQDNTGNIEVSASNGTPNYQFSKDGTTYQTATIFSGLSAGNYSISAKDGNNCTTTLTVVLTQPNQLGGTITPTPNLCNGDNTGKIDITASGGTTPYQYSKDAGANYQNTSLFSGLTANSYSLKIKDSKNCVFSQTITVSQPTVLTASAAVSQQVSCFSGSDAIVTATGGGGTTPYQYSKDNGTTYQIGAAFSGLPIGSYTVITKDGNGCTKTTNSVTVTQPTDFILSIASKTDVKCFNGSDGVVTLAGTGGTATYTYANGNGAFQTGATFNGLIAGGYTLSAKDAKGCLKTISSTILQPTDLVPTATQSQPVSCKGGNNGILTASVMGGTTSPSYQYSIDNGTTYQTATNFSGLTAGNYTLTVKDGNACIKNATSITVTEPTAVSLVPTISPVLCFGGNTGTINLTAGGGVGNFSYNIGAMAYQNSPAFTGLTAGNYALSVKDGNGCIKTINTTVGQPTDLIVSLAINKQVSCFAGADAIVIGSANGGTTAYQYSKDGTTYQAANSFSGLPLGSYQLTIKDGNGCIKQTNTVNVTQPTNIVLSVASLSNVKCLNGSDAVVTVSGTGGTGAYTYANGNGSFQTSPTFSGLSAGSYTFIIKDANACLKNLSVAVSQPAQAFTFAISSQTNLSCYQNTSGSLNVQGAGGTSPYYFSLDNSTFQTSTVFNGLSALTYTVYAKDANNCVFNVGNISLGQPTDIVVSLLRKKDVDCEYYQRGEALVGATGSNGNFTYILSGTDFRGNATTGNTNTTGLFPNLLPGNYIIAAKDQVGCSKNFPVTIIPKSSGIRYDIAKTLPSNCTNADGQIIVQNITGGRQPFQFQISTSPTFTGNPTFSNLLGGTYLITVADSLCSYKQAVDISLPNSLKATYNINPISCAIPNANLQITGVTGGNGGYSWSLNGGAFTSNPNYTNLVPLVYALTLQDSPLSCKSVVSFEIKEQNRSDLQLTAKTDISCFNGSDGIIKVAGDNNLSPYTYAINNGGFSNNNTFGNLPIGTYRLLAKNSFGCIDSIKVSLIQPTQLGMANTKKDNDCFADNTGRIEAVGNGGTVPYTYAVNGGTFQSSGTFTGLIAGNYTLSIKDKLGCNVAQNLNIVQPTLVTVTPMYKDTVLCLNDANGSTQIVAAGGTPGYSYSKDGSNYFSTNTFSNLTAGTYTFYVKDNKQCVQTKSLTLTQPTKLLLNLINKTDPLCYGDANGRIEISASGGNSGYVFQTNSTIQTSPVFTGLPEATYNFKVTDRKGCSEVLTQSAGIPIKLTWPLVLQWSAQSLQTRCFNEANGSITLAANGGTRPYQYSKNNGSNYQPDSAFTGLTAGSYQIITRDANGCRNLKAILVTQPDLLTVVSTKKNNDCFADNTGQIEVSGRGGNVPYSYSIDGTTYQSQSTFLGLYAKDYTLYTKDSKGCANSQIIPIVQPSLVLVNPIYQDTVRCLGESNGSVRVLTAGGTPGYRYSLDGNSYFADSLFKNLKSGSYTFYVKDKNQCVQKNNIILTEPTYLRLNLISKTDPLCYGDKNGVIVLAAGGGNGGYVYQTNATIQNSPTFKGLTEANYSFSVTDRRGCTEILNQTAGVPIQLTWPKRLTWTSQTIMPLCFGEANGSILLAADGGTIPYQATLLTSVQPENATGNFTFKNIPADSYNIEIKDKNGCVNLQTITLPQPSQLATKITPKNNDCFGDATGRIEAQATGATMPYQYSLDGSNYQTAGVFEGLKANVYSLWLKDQNGCVINPKVPIVQPTLVTLLPLYADTVRCNGENNGIVSLVAQGGVGGYSYSKDGSNYLADSAFKNLKAGSYEFSVKDNNKCLTKANIGLNEPVKLSVSLVSRIDPSCAGDTNGSIKVQAVGGNSGYYFVMDNRVKNQKGSFTELSQATYLIRATDRRGCTDDLAPVQLNWPKPLSASVKTTSPVCVGDANGSVVLDVSGGVSPYVATLNNNQQNSGNTLKISQLPAGRQVVYISDQNGCRITLPVSIASPQSLNDIVFPKAEAVCKGQEVILNANNANRTVKWFLGTKEISQAQEIRAVEPGIYRVDVQNETGCLKSESYTLVNNNNALKADFLMPIQAFVGDTVYALDISQPYPDEVKWTYPAEAFSIEKNIKRGVFTIVSAGNYVIKMTAIKGECFNNKERDIKIFDRKDIDQTDEQLGYKNQVSFTKIIAYPNPNYGKFKIDIETNKVVDVDISITRSTTAALVYKTSVTGKKSYTLDISLTDFVQDTYVITVRAGQTAKNIKILIMN